MPDRSTRRHFLATVATSTAGGLAGCTSSDRDDRPEFLDEARSTEGQRTTTSRGRPPQGGPVAFPDPHGGDGIRLHGDLPPVNDWLTADEAQRVESRAFAPSQFDVTISPDTITLAIPEMSVGRPVDIEARYLQADGATGTARQRIDAVHDELTFESFELTFDVSDVTFPKGAEGRVEFTVHDVEWPDEYGPRSLHRQRFVAFDYDASTGSATTVLDDVPTYELTLQPYPNRLAIEYVDTDAARELFFVMYGSGELYPAQTAVPHDVQNEYERHEKDGEYREAHHTATYMHNADEVPYLRGLADSLGATLDRKGITDRFERLQRLAYFVGNLPYDDENPTYKDPQHSVLYTRHGDCSEMTMLYLALMNTPAFDYTRGCYIVGQFDGVRHAMIGIDGRDIDPPNPDAIHWVRPSEAALEDCFPDTRYAFLEATVPQRIGKYVANRYEIYFVVDTTDLVCTPELREFGDA